jgi:hypothetical protein
MCALQHGETLSCVAGSSKAFRLEFIRALKLYAPLNLIMAVVFNGRRLLNDPMLSITHLTSSILRSSLFLTCYWYIKSS